MKRYSLSTAIALAITASLPGAAHAVRIDYSIDAGYERDDNVTLSATNPVEQDVMRLGLGFAIEQNTSAVQMSLNGRLDHRRYEDIYPNATDRMLNGRLNWMIVPERFGFVVEDSYGVQTVDRFEPDSPDNRQQINVLSLGPNFYFNFGRTLLGQAELRFIDSNAEITEDFNSQRVAAALRAIKNLDATSTLSLNLQMQDVDFDNDLFARDHKRYELFSRYRRTYNRFDMQFDGGYSRIDYRDGDSRNNPVLRAELGWNPSPRSRFAVNAANQLSDAATGALEAISTEAGIPASVITGNSTVTASVYEETSVGANYEYIGERTTFAAHASAQDIEYFDALENNEESRGAGLAASYRLQPTLVLRGSAAFDRTKYRTGSGRTEENRLYTIGLEKEWARHWSSSLQFSRYQRDSSALGADFEQNVIYLSVTYRNR